MDWPGVYLQGEPAMRWFAASPALADVRVVSPQGFVSKDLKLDVQPLQFRPYFLRRRFLFTLNAKAFCRPTT